MNVVAYTAGLAHPSSRLRVRQYAPLLRSHGITLKDCPVPWDTTMPRQKLQRLAWGVGTVAWRAAQIPASYAGAVTLIQRQTLPGYYSLHRFMKGPCVLDVDDAVWLTRGGQRAAAMAASCEAVICGNRYLADFFKQWNNNVKELATPVDTRLINPGPLPLSQRQPIIGWTGTSENYKFLYQIEKALARVLRAHPQARLLTVADSPPSFTEIPSGQSEHVPWSVTAEAEALKRMTIGIMPLDDTPWSRGKCSFKMLCYMAAGLPVVVSPVGMNIDVLATGDIGYGPESQEQWIEALDSLLSDPAASATRGWNARQVAVTRFSLDVLGGRLASHLYQVQR